MLFLRTWLFLATHILILLEIVDLIKAPSFLQPKQVQSLIG